MMRALLISMTLLLGACEYHLGNPLPCEYRFGGIEGSDQSSRDDIFVFDTTYSYNIKGVDKVVVDELIEKNPGSTLSSDGSNYLLNITKPNVAREDALETGCAGERGGMSLTGITFGKASGGPED